MGESCVILTMLSMSHMHWWCAGDFVAHVKFTVLLMPNGSDRITSHPLQELQPTKPLEDPEIKAWLALGVKTKKKGGGKKKKGMWLSGTVSIVSTSQIYWSSMFRTIFGFFFFFLKR